MESLPSTSSVSSISRGYSRQLNRPARRTSTFSSTPRPAAPITGTLIVAASSSSSSTSNSSPNNAVQTHTEKAESSPSFSRRCHLGALLAAPLLPLQAAQAATSSTKDTNPANPTTTSTLATPVSIPNYSADGPCQPVRLPLLEHTCTTCGAPAERSRIRIQAFYPKGGPRLGLHPPFPLAIITGGFLIGSDQYCSYAERLASWGYCVLTYDIVNQQALDPLNDIICVKMLRELIDWARSGQPLSSVTNTEQVFVVGHSRGAKISTLAATMEPRIKALLLLDPVDVTVYAPLAPDYPSATANLASMTSLLQPHNKQGPPPVAIIGSGLGSDCAPPDSNYNLYYDSAPGAAFEAVLTNAGHLQFLDARNSNLMDAVCSAGSLSDAAVREISQGVMVAWAEATMKRPGLLSEAKTPPPVPLPSVTLRNTSSTDAASSSREGLRFGVGPTGEVVAGDFPAIDALTQLYAAIREAKAKAGIEINIETRAKNFSMG